MILEWMNSLGPWAWVVLGLMLMGLEMLVPGAFFIWIGLAAIVTGVIDGALNLEWQASLLVFAILAVCAVIAGRKIMGVNHSLQSSPDAATINQRGASIIGSTFTLHEPIQNGHGQIKIDDTVWRATGVDQPAGAQVKVTRIDGATLIVEAV
jgi:membrane protein implicated in regulation of membrane protease activity